MRWLTKVFVFVAKLILAVLIGRLIFAATDSIPTDMPYSIDMAIRWMLHLAGQDDLANPDDMEVIAGITLMVVTIGLGILIVWGGHALLRGVRRRLSTADSAV